MHPIRLCRCDECKFSDPDQIDRVTGKPFCINWKQYLDCGCFYGVSEYAPKREGNYSGRTWIEVDILDDLWEENSMKLQDILKTKKEVEADGYTIVNNIIETVDVKIIGIHGNVQCMTVFCKDIVPVCNQNNLPNLGFLIQAFFELFDVADADWKYLSDIKDIPCRLIFTGEAGRRSRCVGFGNFMKDRFVYTGDFVKINEV